MKRRSMVLGGLSAAALVACGGGGGSAGDGLPADAPIVDLEGNFTTGQDAARVIGQLDFESRVVSPSGLVSPFDLALADDLTMFVSDNDHHQVEAWSHFLQNAPSHQFNLGQADGSWPPAVARGTMQRPTGVAIRGSRMAVADTEANRVLVYAAIPSSNTPPAVILGQPTDSGDDVGCNNGMSSPSGVCITPSGKLLVADAGNRRILIWNDIAGLVDFQAPDHVLGQPISSTCGGNVVSGVRFAPSGVWSDDDRLVVTCAEQHRVLVWDSLPTDPTVQPTLVLGQGAFDRAIANDTEGDGTAQEGSTPSDASMWQPYCIACDGTKLAISDMLNHRVMVWNHFPTETFQSADAILGQEDAMSSFPNSGDGAQDPDTGQALASPNRRAFDYPSGLAFSRGRLLVVDNFNSRVLVFEPTA